MSEPSDYTGSEAADLDALRAALEGAHGHGTQADIDRALEVFYLARVRALVAEKRRLS